MRMSAPPEDAAPPEAVAAEERVEAGIEAGTAAGAEAGAGSGNQPAAEEAAPPIPVEVTAEAVRIAEALLFASDRPVQPARLQQVLPDGQPAEAVLAELARALEGRGVLLAEVAGGFVLRTAPDLAPALTRVVEVPRRLPRVAMETLAVIAWHQPVTRAEVEEIRGAGLSQATLEALLEHGLVAPKGHKEVPGRPTLWGTTGKFLEQFGLKSLKDLPRREELVSAEAAAPLLSAVMEKSEDPEAIAEEAVEEEVPAGDESSVVDEPSAEDRPA
jgi:segregation and condensation protein B